MLPTLQILWEAAHSAGTSGPTQEQRARFRACEEKILDRFGLDFVNELDSVWDDIHLAELDRAYESGFLAAFRLWIEVMSARVE